jgi:hypothetical protein
MKKLALGLFLVSAALGVLSFPAAADAPRSAPALSAADRAFLASIAAPMKAPDRVMAARKPIGEAGQKSYCSAQANCEWGTVSCEGNNSCSAWDRNCSWGEVGHVTCDGNTYACPTQCCPDDFCTRDWQCQQNCYPCQAIYSCYWNGCHDSCDCQWSTCPP